MPPRLVLAPACSMIRRIRAPHVFSARAHDRILKVARTIANLD
jgi:hypothetical protein